MGNLTPDELAFYETTGPLQSTGVTVMGMDRIVRTSDNMEQASPISSTQRLQLIITAQGDRIKALEVELDFAYRAGESVQVDLETQSDRIKALEAELAAVGS